MQFTGALITEQGITFGVAVVQKHVLHNQREAAEMVSSMQAVFNAPTVLMAQDHTGRAEYYGRDDIVRFLASVSVDRIPWKKYTLN